MYILRTRKAIVDLSSTKSAMSKHLSKTTSMLRASGKRVSAVFPNVPLGTTSRKKSSGSSSNDGSERKDSNTDSKENEERSDSEKNNKSFNEAFVGDEEKPPTNEA